MDWRGHSIDTDHHIMRDVSLKWKRYIAVQVAGKNKNSNKQSWATDCSVATAVRLHFEIYDKRDQMLSQLDAKRTIADTQTDELKLNEDIRAYIKKANKYLVKSIKKLKRTTLQDIQQSYRSNYEGDQTSRGIIGLSFYLKMNGN
eukprot:537812_1